MRTHTFVFAQHLRAFSPYSNAFYLGTNEETNCQSFRLTIHTDWLEVGRAVVHSSLA